MCFSWVFFRNPDFQSAYDMLNQVFTYFNPELITQLIQGYWQVFLLMAIGFILHFVPRTWENGFQQLFIKIPFIGKALVLIALIFLVIQIKSSEIQPFIYFQF